MVGVFFFSATKKYTFFMALPCAGLSQEGSIGDATFTSKQQCRTAFSNSNVLWGKSTKHTLKQTFFMRVGRVLKVTQINRSDSINFLCHMMDLISAS